MRVDNYQIDTPIVDIVRQIKSELTNGKLRDIELKGDMLHITCPNSDHKGGHEDHPSAGIHIKDPVWFSCFTCGTKTDFAGFVALCFDQSREWAKRWLIERYGMPMDTTNIPEPIMLDSEHHPVFTNQRLDDMLDYHPYMDKRHLTAEVVKQFNIKYDPKTECLVFPVYNQQHQLQGLTRRSVVGKQFIIDRGFDKSNLYAVDQIKNCSTVYIVESQINCLTLWSWGYPAIATFGCGCARKQVEQLNKLDVIHYVLAFDPDEAGIHGTNKLCEQLSDMKFVDVVCMPEGKDVNDLTKQQFDQLKVLDRIEWLGLQNK